MTVSAAALETAGEIHDDRLAVTYPRLYCTARPCAVCDRIVAFGAAEFERGREAGLEEAAICVGTHPFAAIGGFQKDMARAIRALRSGAGGKG